MKKTLIVCLLVALLASMLVGCGKKQTQQPEPEPTVTEQPAQEPSATPDPATEAAYQAAMSAYETVMEQNCDVVYNGIGLDGDYPLVSTGVMELSSMERGELLQYLGYAFEDVSGDGVPELLIGTILNADAEVPEVQLILAGYTCKNGEAVRFLEGWARNVYEWLGDGRFFNYASGGYAYSAFGTFHISEDGTELSCEEWYFSDLKSENDAEIAYYHNTTGSWDKNTAEELDIDSDAFWKLSEKWDAEIKTLEFTPFADYPYTGYVAQPLDCKVRVDFFDDVNYQNYYDDASEYMDAGTAYETKVLFQSDEGAPDFKLLALSLRNVDENGNAVYDIAEVFSIPGLRAGIPLAAPMSFPGDIPSNGFSYTDTDGTTKTYALSISGRDGSLMVTPLENIVTADMALTGVSNYCHEAYDWSVANGDPNVMYVELGEETAGEYQVVFRSYTGSFVYFHVDKRNGEAKMVEYVPTLELQESAGSINIYDYLA